MKKLLLLPVLALLISCSTEDKEEQFCGTVTGRGHSGTGDVIQIQNGNDIRSFEVSNYMDYPLRSYQCK